MKCETCERNIKANEPYQNTLDGCVLCSDHSATYGDIVQQHENFTKEDVRSYGWTWKDFKKNLAHFKTLDPTEKPLVYPREGRR